MDRRSVIGKLDGRVALVTASGSGMGRASAELFASEGAKVIVADLDLAAAEQTAAAITAAGGHSRPYAVDVGDVEALRALFDMVEHEYGILHVLYNHAGTPGPDGLAATEDELDRFL